ncbi:MAG: hypothetical protein AUK24_01505 [Syntrophaceae bacterium CG2_30_49_12]|nr:MAG: hypothetical protein AUK24_01505 [Syntrophaceae bacterium CG2_30_49_12]PIP07461.1 MAG: hypothetical protein COX52_03630 [Syntrophobacterales bacterium CG23_combo_of_CG06-09_8_20_14_all_48_27]PJA49635.1 MAG: hypothetical protein CO171_04675 [Syntrophobacterales bacterium CG_4_9_14_3_um_filter_49_8]PJC73654.1 MAG: hypothetical protein CO012_08595 [Syntrophobacterales bacterium CG_4_8_14_3_um_filter_49_14]
MNQPAKLSDLIEALEFDSSMHIMYFDRQTGRVVSVDRDVMSGVEEGDEEQLQGLPDWQKEEVEIAQAVCDDNGERFISAPDKFEFHEYRHMERFIETVENEKAAEALWRAIRGRGAFRYFKDTAERLGLLERWFRYRDEAMKEFVIVWAEANNVPFDDDLTRRS